MAFHYRPLIDDESRAVAARFAEAADARVAATRDSFAWQEAVEGVWNEAAALGWPQLLLPESAGGLGGALDDAMALIEGAARFALPAPLAPALVVAPRLADAALLQAMASGDVRVGVVLDGAYPWLRDRPGRADFTIRADRIDGTATGVEMTPGATHLLVAAGDRLALIAAASADIRLHRRIDGRLAGDLRLDGVTVERSWAAAGLADALDLGALVACVEIVGGAATVIEDTIGYLAERRQFDVALSSFQVLRHAAADMYIAYQNAHALTAATLRAVRDEPVALPWRDIARCKLRVGEVGRFVAETSIQLHGGMGMTEENRATRIGKRLILADLEWGDRAWQAERLLDASMAAPA